MAALAPAPMCTSACSETSVTSPPAKTPGQLVAQFTSTMMCPRGYPALVALRRRHRDAVDKALAGYLLHHDALCNFDVLRLAELVQHRCVRQRLRGQQVHPMRLVGQIGGGPSGPPPVWPPSALR